MQLHKRKCPYLFRRIHGSLAGRALFGLRGSPHFTAFVKSPFFKIRKLQFPSGKVRTFTEQTGKRSTPLFSGLPRNVVPCCHGPFVRGTLWPEPRLAPAAFQLEKSFEFQALRTFPILRLEKWLLTTGNNKKDDRRGGINFRRSLRCDRGGVRRFTDAPVVLGFKNYLNLKEKKK